MRCKTVRKLLTDYVDGLLGDRRGRALRDHLASCEECRAEEAAARVVPEALAAWKDVPAPEDGFARLETRIAFAPRAIPAPEHDGRGRILRFALAYGAGFATAAAILVAGWAVWLRPGALPALPVEAPVDGTYLTDADPRLLPGEVPLHVVDPGDGGLNVIDWPSIRSSISRQELEQLLLSRTSAVPVEYRGD